MLSGRRTLAGRHSSRVLWLVLLLLAGPVAGAELYKWQDAEGIWHFGDRPPTDTSEFETFLAPADPRPMVSMRRLGSERAPEHWFFNHYHGPAELGLRVSDAVNIHSDPPLPASVVLAGQSELRAVSFRSASPDQGFQYRLAYELVPGAPLTEIPEDLDYHPPFAAGQQFPISQGLDDASTHTDSASRYAVDIVMPEGTPVLAARAGLVMDAEDDFQGGGRHDQKLLPRANQVRILHEDGSMAQYAHLQTGSLQVRAGQRVKLGQWLANSGNTGYSNGPHLHFVVQMNAGLQLESLPFRFRTTTGFMDPDHPQMLAGVLPGPAR